MFRYQDRVNISIAHELYAAICVTVHTHKMKESKRHSLLFTIIIILFIKNQDVFISLAFGEMNIQNHILFMQI